ncbi:MAG: hypothetical protein P8099_00930 [Gemmatimonadota bacterium]|jgi:hypothetical protein
MIQAHNIRHALLGALVFIVVGSFGACSTDPTAPSTEAMTAPTQTLASKTTDSCQTIDGSTVCTTESATIMTKPKCIQINGLWYCTD